MTFKSIIDVDVNDQNFKKFHELFQKYQANLTKIPAAWKAANSEAKSALDAAVAATLAQQAISESMVKSERVQEKSAKATAAYWHSIGKSTSKVVSNINHITKSLLKWTALTSVVSGVLGVGGLFGIDRLAAGVFAGRRSATGLGVSYGEEKAFGVNYGRLVDPQQFLGGVNEALHDVTKRVGLYGAGLTESDLRGKNAAQLSPLLLEHLKRLADQTPESQLAQVLHARQLDQFVNLQEFQRLRHATPAEMARYRSQFGKDQQRLNLADDVQRKWQDFSVQLSRAGQVIENVFVRDLTALVPGLEKLSQSVAKAVDAFLSSPNLQVWITKVGAALEHVGQYLGSDQFQTDVKDFAAGIATLAHSVAGALRWLGAVATPANPNGPRAPIPFHGGHLDEWYWYEHNKKSSSSREYPWWMGGPSHNPGNLRDPSGIGFAHFSSDREGLMALQNQLLKDETLHRQTTLRQLIYGNKNWPGYTTTDREAYLRNLVRGVGLAPDAQLDPTNRSQLARIMAVITKQEGRSPYPEKTIVEILNNTGGNAITQTSQVAQ